MRIYAFQLKLLEEMDRTYLLLMPLKIFLVSVISFELGSRSFTSAIIKIVYDVAHLHQEHLR